MKIILATGNNGKIKEFKELMPDDEVIAYCEIVEPFEIIEDGDTFGKNAVIKAKAVNEKLKNILTEPYLVISDDSGITVPVLNNEPDIYSARYAGENASDKDNLEKLVSRLKEVNLKEADAYYTAAMATVYNDEIFTVHGWMHGKVVDTANGDKGFGYDPIFIPTGYNQTLACLDSKVKKSFSHRSNALKLAQRLIKVLCK